MDRLVRHSIDEPSTRLLAGRRGVKPSKEGLVERRSSSGCDGRSEARTQGAFVSAAIRARLRTQPRGEQRGPAAQQMFRQTLLGPGDRLVDASRELVQP